jgi:catechol 2,3-dioxygenase-like lactoylglutathione lyase family enzyme
LIERISAVTLATRDMAKSVQFYTALGFVLRYGGKDASFTTFDMRGQYLNLTLRTEYYPGPPWGRIIFYVSDVDTFYSRALAEGLEATTGPRDAEWGERYFHILDPDGHELSFARPLR